MVADHSGEHGEELSRRLALKPVRQERRQEECREEPPAADPENPETLRSEAEQAHEHLSTRIIELYAGGASIGVVGARAVGLFLDAPDEMELNPGEALKKIWHALQMTDEVSRRAAMVEVELMAICLSGYS